MQTFKCIFLGKKQTDAVAKKKDRGSKVVKVLMFKLQLPAAGFDGLLKKPFKEILRFTHKTCQSEWRAASPCATQRRD